MSKPLRAMVLTGSASQGGAERQSITLLNRLADRGHTVRLLHVKAVGEGVRLADGSVSESLGAERYLDWSAVKRLAAEIAGTQPSIVIAVNPYALMYAALARGLTRHRSLLAVTYHTTRLLGLKERLQTAAYRPLFWSADCTIFVCAQQRNFWLRRGLLSRRNEVIYNGVDVTAYSDQKNPSEVSALRQSLGLDQGEYVIGISAWMRPEKNHTQLVDALAELRRRGIAARVLMIGDGEMRDVIEHRARRVGVDQQIVYTGAQSDVRPFVAVCDVMVICSVAVETFSLAALEAMAMAKPVVHSDLGGASEMITPGCNGFVFPVGDTKTLVARLVELSDRSAARRMGASGRAIVCSRFSEGTMVDRYENLFAELCHPD